MRNPVTGITTARVSAKAVDTHWPVLASIDRSFIRTGIATVMIVSLRMTTNAATSSTVMTVRSRADSFSVARGATEGGGAVRVMDVSWNGSTAGCDRVGGRRRTQVEPPDGGGYSP